ncbi:MAG: tRNA pseudouridine(55) synthase TruB [Pseudomonadota bacterium]|nr:tRNA pseudouridine(55) synthase TruB [Pseudomonadota bacterium]
MRNIHGILLFNKPTGFSSNAALQRVKRLFQARKAGHTGSLDKLASGLLPICFGEATKLAGFLLEADKCYQAECTLGTTTSTGDAEGAILTQAPLTAISAEQIAAVLPAFRGSIQQIPPMYSALKSKGQPLYKLARQGQVITRTPRTVTIYQLKLLEVINPQCVTLDIRCSKGTYIRTLVEDIGQALGCGAYVSALHRSAVGEYQDMVDLATLEAQEPQNLVDFLKPLHSVLTHWPSVNLSLEIATYIRKGQTVHVACPPRQGWVKLLTEEDEFLGIGQVLADGRIAPKRLINS